MFSMPRGMRNAGSAVGPGDASSSLMIVLVGSGTVLGLGSPQTGCRTLLRPARGIPSGVSGLVVLCCLAGCLLGWVGFLSGFGSSGALDRGWDPGKVGGLLRMGQLVGPYCGSGGDRVKPGLDSPADPGKVEGLPRRSSVRLLRR
jgi:hypothetical protein